MIEAVNICKVYGRPHSGAVALNGVNMRVDAGERMAIVGPSGCGKTTLLNIIGALARPSSGRVLWNGQDISKFSRSRAARLRNGSAGFVFQTFNLVPSMTVGQNVALPLRYARSSRRLRQQRVQWALDRVGLADKAQRLPADLSGGEQQRTAIARAVVTKPDAVLADEPTGNLDSATGGQIMDLLFDLNAEGTTLMLVTHNVEIEGAFPRVLRLCDGVVVSDADSGGGTAHGI